MEEKQFLKEYFNKDNTVFDVKRKLRINNKQYSKLYHKYQLNKEKRHMNYTNARYYEKLKNGKISIRKWIGKDKKYLGCYATTEDADAVVETCKEHDWNMENKEVQKIIEELRVKPKNYYKNNGRYYVFKNINGKKVYYDSFKEEQDAIDCVNLLRKLEWNKTVYEQLKVII